ncbi:condensation domain-containing protein [Tistrella bauzanensis]
MVLLLAPGDLPRTTSGKLRRSACLAGWRDGSLVPVAVHDQAEAAPAGTPAAGTGDDMLTARLQAVWQSVFGRPVGLDEDFFDLGGQSLLAARLLAEAGDALGLVLPPAAVFDARSIRAQAAWIADRGDRLARPPIAAEGAVVAEDGTDAAEAGVAGLPLTPGQAGLWFLWRMAPEAATYNVAGAVTLKGALDASLMRDALLAVVRRHDALRCRFVEVAGRPRQVIDRDARIDWSEVDADAVADGLRAHLAGVAARPFDLEAGPLLRACLVRIAPDRDVLLLALHHIVTDAWSGDILLRDLLTAYAALAGGAAPAWAAPPAIMPP